jgi:hypothetical protein
MNHALGIDFLDRPQVGDVGRTEEAVAGTARSAGRRRGARFGANVVTEAVATALADAACILVNRNRGSGTRVLVDQLLGAARLRGYLTEAQSYNAVAAASLRLPDSTGEEMRLAGKACRGLYEAMIVFISQTNKKARTVCLCLRFITREREGQTCPTASVAST